MVKPWLKTTAFPEVKIFHFFEIYFCGSLVEGMVRKALGQNAASADGSHGGSEEEFEVVGGFGVLLDGGLDGFLRDGAGIAEVDQRGEGVVAGGSVVRASGCGGDSYGEIV